MSRHDHKCDNCGHVWPCTCTNKKGKLKPIAKCPVTKAAKSNGEGPWCKLCYHLKMAHSLASHRGIVEVKATIEVALETLEVAA